MEQIKTVHFGEVAFSEPDVIHFPRGIPGFETLTRFLLIEGAVYEPFRFLQSIEAPGISLPLLDPQTVEPDYRFQLKEDERSLVGLEKAEDGLVYCVVTINSDPKDVTINLFAPLILNRFQRTGAQVILLETSYRVDQPLLQAV